MEPDLESFVRATVASPRAAKDHSWRDGRRPVVLEVRDSRDRPWFVKRHVVRDVYLAEVTAYRRWALNLGDRAPRLHASDDDLHAIVVSALPGKMPEDWQDPMLQLQAGNLLRNFHEAESFPQLDEVIARKLCMLDSVTARANGLVTARALEFTRSELKALDGIAPQRQVPCHLDFSPRNWLVHDGLLHVIDFGDAGPDAWVNDFGRLLIGWGLRGEGKEALLDGYGHTPSAEDFALLRASYALTLISQIVFAREHEFVQVEAAFLEVLRELVSGERDPESA